MTVKINPFVNCAANVKGFFSHYCNELGWGGICWRMTKIFNRKSAENVWKYFI
jgi:hypothetical protein